MNVDEFPVEFLSHVDGQDALVAIYQDRIEWFGAGVKVGARFHPATWSVPLGRVHGVTAHPRGFGRSALRVATSGDVIEFRMSSDQAEAARDLLLGLAQRLTVPAV